MILDRGPTPLYYQLKSVLKAKIRSQELKEKERLPSEAQLCQEFNVSRITVRQALAELMKAGLIYRDRGKGTFITEGAGLKKPTLKGSIEDLVDDESEADSELEPGALAEEADRDAPIIKLVHSIIAQAVQQGASDIHVNPEEGDAKVLFRVDGVLAPAATVKRRMRWGWCRGSRSWAISTSPRGACPRTVGSR